MSDGRPPPSMGTPVALPARRTLIMDITTLAAWGELLGGIAVVVSLIYLASQIRQNSQLLRTSPLCQVGATGGVLMC